MNLKAICAVGTRFGRSRREALARAVFGQGGTKRVAFEMVEGRVLFDALPPSASGSIEGGGSVDEASQTLTIRVNYSDTDGLNTSTIGQGDIVVTGPNGFSQVATFVSFESFSDNTGEAIYTVVGPGGGFDRADKGAYTVTLQAGEVSDLVGNSAAAPTDIDTFDVDIPITIDSSGPITQIAVGDDGRFQVKNSQFSSGQFFSSSDNPANAGLLIRIPDASGTFATTYGFRGNAFTPVSQDISGDGLTVTTVFDVGNQLRVTSVTSYVPGDQFFRITNAITNLSTTNLTFDVFFAADLYLADSDSGVGFFNPATNAVGGTDRTGQYNIFFQGNPAVGPVPTNYQEGRYSEVFAVTTSDSEHFNNTVELPTTAAPYTTDPAFKDNGAGIEWQAVSLAPGGGTTLGLFAAFGNITTAGGSVSGTLASVGQPAYGDLTVDISVNYTGTGGVATSSLGDDDITLSGPQGFSTHAAFISSSTVDGVTTALYRAAAPSGGFTDKNNGTYTVRLTSGSVTSTGGGASGLTTLGTLSTSVSAPTIGGTDQGFGNGGVVTVTIPAATLLSIDSVRQADGTVLSGAYDATTNSLLVTRFLDNGQIDASFGAGGFLRTALPGNFTARKVVVDAAGRHIFVVGIATDSGQPTVVGYTLAGALDGAFGSGGVLAVTAFQPGDRIDAFVGVPGSGEYLAGGAFVRSGATSAVLARVNGTGALNAKFGNKGVYQRAAGGPLDTIGSIAFGPKNAIVLAGTASQGAVGDNSVTSSVLVVSLSSSGKISKGFNKTGEFVFTPAGFGISSGQKVLVQADGKILVTAALATSAGQAAAGNFGAGVLRLTPKGGLDQAIGTAGFIVVKQPSATTAGVRRYGTLVAPTIEGREGSVTDVLTAPETLVQIPGGKVRQIAADDAGDSTAVTQTQITVDAVDLVAQILGLSNKKPYKVNAKASATVSVSNAGTLTAPGTVPVEVYISTDDVLDISRDTLLATVPVKVALTPGKTKALKVSVKTPGEQGTYFVFARVNSGASATPELTLGNNLALPQNSILVTTNGKPLPAGLVQFPGSGELVGSPGTELEFAL